MSKVMLVVDDADLAEVVEIILVSHGFEVVTILDGRQVFETVACFQPDVILLDVNIAGIDGRNVCKELKADHSPYKGIPVVLFSAMHDLTHTYHEWEASDYISKPFNTTHLVNTLKKYTAEIN